jgi:molybdate transport system permease protein
MLQLTPMEIEALLLSLKVGLWSVSASLPFGIALAWLLARRDFPGKILVNGFLHLPLVLPPRRGRLRASSASRAARAHGRVAP